MRTAAQRALLAISFLLLPVLLCAQAAVDTEVAKDVQDAQLAEKAGDYQKAAAEYKAALKQEPDIAEFWVNYGLDLYVLKQDDEATAAFQQALKRKANLPGADLFMGTAYVRHNQYEKAIDPLKKAIAFNPRELRAYINLGVAYQETGHEEDAARILEKADDLFPKNTEVLYNLGRIYTKLMEKSYQKMAQADPDSYRYHQVMGDSYELRRDYPDATAEYLKALAKCPDPYLPGLHYSLGSSYWMEARWDDAIEQFKQELAISSENYMATWKLADCYLYQRNYDKVRVYLQKALQQKPDLPQADRDMGKLLFQTGQSEQALVYLNRHSVPSDPRRWRIGKRL